MNTTLTTNNLPISATVIVSPPQATGLVTLFDGGRPIANGTLVNGTVTFPRVSLLTGQHPLTALYGGDTLYRGSASAPVTVAVIIHD